MLRMFLVRRDDYRWLHPDWFRPLVNSRALLDVRAAYPGDAEALRACYVRWVHRWHTVVPWVARYDTEAD